MEDFEFLRTGKGVNLLTNNELQILFSNLTKIRYAKNEKIIKSGEFVKSVLFVEKGYVKIHAESKGKGVILNIFGPGRFAGLPLMFGKEKHEYDVSALDDTSIIMMDIKVILGFIETNPVFAKFLVATMSDVLIHYINHNFIRLNQNHIHGRLANTLLYLSHEVFHSLRFDLLLSRKELSQFSNISRENVIKVLYEFNKEGLIKLSGKHIQILKPEQLNRLAEIC